MTLTDTGAMDVVENIKLIHKIVQESLADKIQYIDELRKEHQSNFQILENKITSTNENTRTELSDINRNVTECTKKCDQLSGQLENG